VDRLVLRSRIQEKSFSLRFSIGYRLPHHSRQSSLLVQARDSLSSQVIIFWSSIGCGATGAAASRKRLRSHPSPAFPRHCRMRLVDSLRSVVYLGDAPFPPVAVRGKTNGCSAPVVADAAFRATARPPLSPLHLPA
jgi:hypothetical protein